MVVGGKAYLAKANLLSRKQGLDISAMSTLETKLAELEKLEQVATPGPWEKVVKNESQDGAVAIHGHSLLGWANLVCCQSCYANFNNDAQLAVTLRNELPYLISTIRKMKKALEMISVNYIPPTDGKEEAFAYFHCGDHARQVLKEMGGVSEEKK